MADPFQTTGFPRRLADAARGLTWLVRTTPNARIHLAATLVAIGLGLWLRLGIAEWLWIAVAVGIVWIAEAFNTALETLANRISSEREPAIGHAKDLAAGAVLAAALAAAAIGVLVFIPRLIALAGGH